MNSKSWEWETKDENDNFGNWERKERKIDKKTNFKMNTKQMFSLPSLSSFSLCISSLIISIDNPIKSSN